MASVNTVPLVFPNIPEKPHKGVVRRFRYYSGIGFMVAVGYMDPGNWATDIQAGSQFGYALLCVVLAASLIAMVLQTLCVRMGVASKRDLAELCRENFHPKINFMLWFLAQIAIIACDFAEVLGTALALKLLFGLPLQIGILLTGFDTLIILGLQGKKIFKIENLIMIMVAIITLAFFAEILISKPDWGMVAAGFVPDLDIFKQKDAWLIAIGILGATVMPHNLYLHSSAVKRRKVEQDVAAKKDAIKLLTIDTLATLTIAFMVNAAILILAASAFNLNGFNEVKDIDEAYYLLAPIFGTSLASIIFAVALFAAGQSSTFTGTIAGQVIFEGFLKLKMPRWKQRFITRSLAIIPAWVGILVLGEGAIGHLLVLSQVVLSMQLPFAIVPLIMFNNNAKIMGEWKISKPMLLLCSLIAFSIISANIYLISRYLT